MGRETRNFRQSKRTGSANYSAQSYSAINRRGSWMNKINILKKGKYGQS